MYFTGAAGITSCDVSLPWRGQHPPPFHFAACSIHNHLTWNFKRRTSQLTTNYHLSAASVNTWSATLGGLLARRLWLIVLFSALIHVENWQGWTKNTFKMNSEVFRRDAGQFIRVCEWLYLLLFKLARPLFLPFHSSLITSGAQTLKKG